MRISTTSPHSIHRQLTAIETTLSSIDERIKSLPEGSATVSKSNGRIRMTGMINGERRSFNQNDMPLVKKLLLRKYLTKKRQELVHAKRALKHYMSFCDNWMGTANQYLADNPLCAGLLKDVFSDSDHPLSAWASRPDPCSAPYQELRTEETLFGLKVRSKSEVMIATYLFENGIPFRYEEPLNANGKIYHPDFTIRDPKSGAFYWYEHLGKMDEQRYIRRNTTRLYDYAMAGIIPSINLIVTYETEKCKLSLPQIAAAIETVL